MAESFKIFEDNEPDSLYPPSFSRKRSKSELKRKGKRPALSGININKTDRQNSIVLPQLGQIKPAIVNSVVDNVRMQGTVTTIDVPSGHPEKATINKKMVDLTLTPSLSELPSSSDLVQNDTFIDSLLGDILPIDQGGSAADDTFKGTGDEDSERDWIDDLFENIPTSDDLRIENIKQYARNLIDGIETLKLYTSKIPEIVANIEGRLKNDESSAAFNNKIDVLKNLITFVKARSNNKNFNLESKKTFNDQFQTMAIYFREKFIKTGLINNIKEKLGREKVQSLSNDCEKKINESMLKSIKDRDDLIKAYNLGEANNGPIDNFENFIDAIEEDVKEQMQENLKFIDMMNQLEAIYKENETDEENLTNVLGVLLCVKNIFWQTDEKRKLSPFNVLMHKKNIRKR